MHLWLSRLAVGVSLFGFGNCALAEVEAPPIPITKLNRTGSVDFEAEILPLLRGSCLACHNRKKAKADLILETPADILKGGENGDVVKPGHASESSLLQVTAHQAKPAMPPKDNKVSAADFTPAQLGLLALWIDQGAKGQVRGNVAIQWQPPAAVLQPIYAVALTADGRFAAAGRANRIHLYDLPTTRPVAALADAGLTDGMAHRDLVQSLAFSPEGNVLASGAFGEIKIWRRMGPTSKPGASAATTFPTTSPASAPAKLVVTSGIGREISAVPGQPAIRVTDGVGKPAREMSHGAAVLALSMRNDGKTFVSIGQDHVAKLWDADKGTVIADLKCGVLAARELAKRERLAQLAAGESTFEKGLVDKAVAAQKVAGDRLKAAGDAKGAAEKIVADKAALLTKAVEAKSAAIAALAADAEMQRAEKLAQAVEKLAGDAEKAAAEAKGGAQPLMDALQAAVEAAKKAAVAARASATALATSPRLKPLADKIAVAEKAREAAEAELQNAQRASATANTELKLAEVAVKKLTDEVAADQVALTAAQGALKQAEANIASAQQALKTADVAIYGATFSPDQQTLASCGEDGFIHLWSAGSGVLLESLRNPGVRSVAFKADGSLLATRADGGAVAWNLGGNWILERTLGTGDSTSPLTDRVNALAFNADGSVLASGSGEPSRGGQIRLWDVPGGRLLQSFDDVHSDAVLALEFSPDGKLLASGAADRFVRVLDLKSGKVVRSLEGHTHHVLGVSWKADGRHLASAGADNQVKIWDVAAGDRKAAVAGFGKEVTAVHFIGTGSEAVAIAADGQIKIVNDAGGVVRALQTIPDFLQAAAVTADGKTMIVGGQTGVMTLWREMKDPPAASLASPLQR